ncbi:RNA polymerase sigma factor [Blastochloris viridis]|uniref:RNA polymerase sigma factor n=1 Tax=Blastochloris viridis TaxID=1079 RepID=A0A0H5BP25_BLAVI|nr:RNA polymerase sigma factor [Blastochloris viridis]ALK08090.1 ECF RNA polymerase sigma factor SigW [Blastochloris viridis]BAR98648.1 RNA polymerase sigma-70 factor [Blastochloris viridis]CUU44012.1 RNA polymerase sigma factor CnrH [Blastochloris viridis]
MAYASVLTTPSSSETDLEPQPSGNVTAQAAVTRATPPASDLDSDDELLRRIGENDESAFALLVRRHIDRAYALALRILDNPADADDVVQDVLLKVWTHRGRWEGGRAKFSTWLYRVVTNRCIDLRRQPRNDDLEAAPEVPDGTPGAESQLHRNEVLNALESAMGQLPDHQRVVLILSYHENLSNAEIAEVMQTTVSAVESLLKRGRQQLRKLLRRQEHSIRQSLTED